ncbi:hypothetical protein GE09DRAFT_1134943 [Coniochaeta sp. 2T2.1]|nr:hypothetical protein GE09DRAFT_1134943 [Coniochaeta sp. 2T2.1]
MALESLTSKLAIAPAPLPSSQDTTQTQPFGSDGLPQPSRIMGQNGSSVAGGADDDSRSTSPLGSGDESYDGLPRRSAAEAAAADFNMQFSQPVDGLPAVFSPGRPSQQDAHHGADPYSHDAASDDLEAIARNVKSEQESPVSTKSKKKKRRKSKDKAQASEHTQDLSIPEPESLATAEELPTISEVSATPEEVADLPAVEPIEEAVASPTSSPKSHKKKKKKSKADKAKGPRLDLNEDPIAGSDDEVIVPSSDRPPRRRRSHHDENGSSRKFKRTSIPTVTEMDASAIDDAPSQEPATGIIQSTQDEPSTSVGASASNSANPAPAPDAFLRRSREPEHYDIGAEEYSSPLVTRDERRARFAPTMFASASVAEVLGGGHTPAHSSNNMSPSQIKNDHSGPVAPVANMDAMDFEAIDPQLEASVAGAVSDHPMGPPPDYYSEELPNYQDEDAVMEDHPSLPQLNQQHGSSQHALGDVDLMSSLEDDALMAMASTQPQPVTDDNRSRSDRSSALHPTPHGNDSNARSVSTASSQSDAQARAAAKESRMALQFMLDRSQGAADATPSDVEGETETGRGRVSTQPDTSNVSAHESSLANGAEASTPRASSSRVNENQAAPEYEASSAALFPASQTSARPTPRSTRTYSRQPKPSFFERGEQATAQAFAELPNDEAAATPQLTKARAKRRLPVDLPEAEASGSPSKRQKSTSKASKAPKNPNAPRKPPGRKKAPETAIRSSTGFLTGIFTKTEVGQVEKAVEAFRSDHDLTQVEVNTIIHQNPKDPELKDNTLNEELWARIMDACPTRPRQKLLNWCRQKFHNFVARATWTPEQDAELAAMIQKHGHKWNVIGHEINRHQKDVRDRFRNYLIAGKNRRENAWDAKEEREFLDIVGEVLAIFQDERRRNPDSDMFKSGKTNEELVDWNVVAERMKQGRTRIQCQEKWRRMREGNKINDTVLAQLVEPDQRWRLKRARHEIASMSHADMYHIVLAIPSVDGGAKEDIRINWKAILESQRKKYHRYTGMLLWSRLRQLVPDQETKNVQQCAKELITMYQSDGGTFAIPGDEAFDEAEEEQLLADIPPPRKRGPGKPKPGKGKARDRGDSTKPVSQQFVHESDSDEDGEGEEVDDGESSRANYNETSPAPEEASAEPSEVQEDDEVSVDLSTEAANDDRGGSVDLGIDSSAYDLPPSSPQPRKSAKSKSKRKEKAASPPPPSSPVKKHKKRYSGEMTMEFSLQKSNTAPATAASSAPPAGSANTSRKRARADEANGSGSRSSDARKTKRAKRLSALVQVDQAPASSDDEMEDIPATLPDAVM